MDTNDTAYSAAKLRDYIQGEVAHNTDLYPHTGIVEPRSPASEMLSYMESIYQPGGDLPPDLQATRAAEDLRRAAASEHVGSSVKDIPAFAVGLTEKDAEISDAQAFAEIQNSLINNHAPYLAAIFGSPNTGKSSLATLYAELWEQLAEIKYPDTPEPVIISNAASIGCLDHHVQDVTEFRELLFGSEDWFESDGEDGTPPAVDPETPVFWIFDEASTHLDARTNSYEVANQYTPLLKRFAKINCDAVHIGHSGYDIHAELRRDTLMTEFLFKTSKKTVEVYASMDEDQGAEKKYELTEVPKPSHWIDPDDFASWSWE
ncbi:hypothetical protein SAMN05216226_10699 [Halovenus aranensis]|uniref:Uncharacterized protein n=1 Tax=Halovenus aranensis TaxID=890420 RepID=A0A1G8VAB6_9EURY|nr:hypothetical protein [Halovenus aranensis]SDJ63008.1 hypothetical protein SAMN05216226_10699 [Halovenus aranensis]